MSEVRTLRPVEVPSPRRKREEALMLLDGWQVKRRMGREIWSHEKHTRGFWISAEILEDKS